MNPNQVWANTIARSISGSAVADTSAVTSALTSTSGLADGGMSFVHADFPAGGINPLATGTVVRESMPTPTAEQQQIVSDEVKPQNSRTPGVVNPGRQSQDPGRGGDIGAAEFKGSGLTAYQIQHYMEGMADIIKAGESITNGFLAYNSGKMRRRALEFEAKQHERNTQLLFRNMREITRAADADANVHRVRGAQHKSDQRVAMAASGFSVGKGIYKNTLYSTDVRTEYNVAMLKLKAGLQNAEILRQIGVEKAQAIIKKAEGSIEQRLGKAKLAQGITSGIAQIFSGGANFYMGYKGEGATKGGE